MFFSERSREFFQILIAQYFFRCFSLTLLFGQLCAVGLLLLNSMKNFFIRDIGKRDFL
ncbi:hypothetical protein CP10139811_0897 [Chlamydia ibidis]|uniref:Uncharacterized protein n=2 Tax=Chlamydia ibidis TaxID=1405396 RepID=S7KFA6_9CHLA|nr:hypothetical protein CP10139811_0897 [Chlamydia ibidis]EQM62908.1 hypothetical protein H359_0216 [Chlamydia ibidis 10-1398/6]